MTVSAVCLDSEDDVLCLLRDHASGERPVTAAGRGPALAAATPLGHKIARHPIVRGSVVRKYGAPIGRATQDIPAGAHVHLHNLRGFLDGADSPGTGRP